MKIALLGYGKMGKEIEKIALERKHEIVIKIDIDNAKDLNQENLQKVDVAIDFSIPDSAYSNIKKCFEAGIPIVCGTTGWLDNFDEVVKYCKENRKTFFYSSNYSIGVNIFFRINKYLAEIMNQFPGYEVEIEEIHHIHKLDAPSGTAISLASGILDKISRKNKWELDNQSEPESLKITSIRENEVPGTHTIKYNSIVDSIEIKHTAKNRKGLALGAVHAAEYILGKTGYYTMEDLMNESKG
jgi:4-hydroxy-tetrahydrodipicolinate reductase